MVNRWLLLAALGAPVWGGAAQADALETCRAGNPSFPQLCACAIARSQAAGIDGPLLDRLLANRWDGVPMDVANRYGQIFLACTRLAVARGATAPPAPAFAQHGEAMAPGAAPNAGLDRDLTENGVVAPGPARLATPAESAAAPLLVTAANDARLGGVTNGYRIALDAPTGSWGRGMLRSPYGETRVQAVRNAAGRQLTLRCDPGTPPILILGPFSDGVPGQGAQIVVRGNGSINNPLFQQGTQFLGFNQNYLATGVTSQQLLDALRRGSSVEVRLHDSGTERFALRESSRVIGDSGCRVTRTPAWLYPMAWEATRHDPWRLGQARHRNGITDALFLPAVQGMAPHLALTCDRRLISQSRVSAYDGTLTGEIVLATAGATDARFPIQFEVRGYAAASPVLSAALLDAMAHADTLSLTFDVNAEPGAFVTLNTTMAGFAEGLPQLTCPSAPGSSLAGGGRDLTGAGQWETILIEAFTDESYHTAQFAVAGAPTLFVTCKGTPSVLGIFTPARPPDLNLRLQVDDDPARTVDSTFIPYRGGTANMGADRDRIGPLILQGGSLRITNRDDPSESFVYPLDGLRDAIAAMPQPCRF